MKKLLVDLVCLLSGRSQEHTGVRPLSLLIISITLCYLSTDTFTTVLLRGRKEIPAAFYEVFLFKAFTHSVLWQARACDGSSLSVCSAINDSCSMKGYSTKMWWYKRFSVCFSGLPVHFTVLSLLTPLPHRLHHLPESLAPGANEARAVSLHLLPSNNYFASFFFFFNFGTFWYIFLLVITWFANTMNATFSSIQRRALTVILLEDTFFPWLLRVFEECLKGLLYPLKSPVSLWHLRKPCWHCARAKSSSSGYHGPPLRDSSGWGSQQAASLGISVTAHRCRMQLQHYPGSDSTKPSTASSW